MKRSRVHRRVTGHVQEGRISVYSLSVVIGMLIETSALAGTDLFFSTSSIGRATLCCLQLHCVSGASWAQWLLWAMQINLFLTDVPCIFHIRAVQEMTKKFPPPSNRPLNPQQRSALPSPHPSAFTSCSSLHAHLSSLYHWNQWNWFSRG